MMVPLLSAGWWGITTAGGDSFDNADDGGNDLEGGIAVTVTVAAVGEDEEDGGEEGEGEGEEERFLSRSRTRPSKAVVNALRAAGSCRAGNRLRMKGLGSMQSSITMPPLLPPPPPLPPSLSWFWL